MFSLRRKMGKVPIHHRRPDQALPPLRQAHGPRLIGTGAGVIFKGSGFYETDYRSDSYKERARATRNPPNPPPLRQPRAMARPSPIRPNPPPNPNRLPNPNPPPPPLRPPPRPPRRTRRSPPPPNASASHAMPHLQETRRNPRRSPCEKSLSLLQRRCRLIDLGRWLGGKCRSLSLRPTTKPKPLGQHHPIPSHIETPSRAPHGPGGLFLHPPPRNIAEN